MFLFKNRKTNVSRRQARGFRPALESLESRLTPSTLYWLGAGSNDNWSNSANWENAAGHSAVPASGDTLVFDSAKVAAGKFTSNNDLTANKTFSLVLEGNSPNFTVGGNGIILGSGGLVDKTTGVNLNADEVQLPIQLNATRTFYVADWLVIGNWANGGGGISGTGGLTKTGAGTMNLTQADSYAGATTVKAGTLELSNNAAIHNDADTTVKSGATLMVDDGISDNLHHLYMSGQGASATLGAHGALTYYGSFDTGSVGGPITLNGNTTVGVSATGSFTISGSISGSYGLTVNPDVGDTGGLLLSGHSTYTGATVLENGGLNVTGALDSAVTIKGGHFAGSGSVGSLTFTGGSYYVFLSSASSTGIHSGGAVNLGGATLNVFLDFAPSQGEQFQVISDGGRTSGSFASSTVTATYGNNTYTFDASDDANGVKLTCTAV